MSVVACTIVCNSTISATPSAGGEDPVGDVTAGEAERGAQPDVGEGRRRSPRVERRPPPMAAPGGALEVQGRLAGELDDGVHLAVLLVAVGDRAHRTLAVPLDVEG